MTWKIYGKYWIYKRHPKSCPYKSALWFLFRGVLWKTYKSLSYNWTALYHFIFLYKKINAVVASTKLPEMSENTATCLGLFKQEAQYWARNRISPQTPIHAIYTQWMPPDMECQENFNQASIQYIKVCRKNYKSITSKSIPVKLQNYI